MNLKSFGTSRQIAGAGPMVVHKTGQNPYSQGTHILMGEKIIHKKTISMLEFTMQDWGLGERCKGPGSYQIIGGD